MDELKEQFNAMARDHGFDVVRVCRPWDAPEVPGRLSEFLQRGYHGQMDWLERRREWRGNPSSLWPEARSVIVLGESYTPADDPLENLSKPEIGSISVYARNLDYHDLIKKRLKKLARWLADKAKTEVKVFVDTAPVPEKPLGQASGLGWQGKHTNLVSRNLGNWFFIGSIFTAMEIEADQKESDHCGNCRACLDICPTNAFPGPYQIDARRCISYLTIEHRGPVDEDIRPLLGNRIYGCDDCLAVCPWNKFAVKARNIGYHARDDLASPRLSELAALDDAGFRSKFQGSPIKRIGRNRLVRNVLYAIGNSARKNLAPVAWKLREDNDEAVADAARWAAEKLVGGST
ncbi:MAG: tRNA epoxyqueuosine(34) reductase QueG [Roseovarius sp.]|nr:tRNA epoxyqueuosine(34) reductase QueG [Roseovarius sp.]MCY4315244.1 tRNA epoxyqueuosine(34) reductase QueG [Roseovarius sp.]